MLCILNIFLINFGQSVDIVVIPLDTEVLSQVNDFDVGRNGVLLQERLALPMSEAEENNIDLVEGHLIRKLQIGITN